MTSEDAHLPDELIVADETDPLEDTAGMRMQTGAARIGGLYLELNVRGYLDIARATGASLPELGPEEDWERFRRRFAIRGIAAAEALETAIAREAPQVPVRVHASLEPNFDTAGPGAVLPPLFDVLLGDDPVGNIASYIGIAEGLRKLLGWLRSRGAETLLVHDGTAMILAAGAIFEATSERDLVLSFVEEIRPMVREWEGQTEGFLVGFRNEGTIFQVPVMLDGTVGAMVLVPIPETERG